MAPPDPHPKHVFQVKRGYHAPDAVALGRELRALVDRGVSFADLAGAIGCCAFSVRCWTMHELPMSRRMGDRVRAMFEAGVEVEPA